MRLGCAGEKYVFNQSGQEIDLEGLICVCGDGQPLGNPVKDSMKGKLTASTDKVLGIIYAPAEIIDAAAMRTLVERFGGLLKRYGGALSVETLIV